MPMSNNGYFLTYLNLENNVKINKTKDLIIYQVYRGNTD